VPLVERQADISPDQSQLAHGQIENSGTFVNERPAQGDESIDAAHEYPCNEELQEKFHENLPKKSMINNQWSIINERQSPKKSISGIASFHSQ